MNKTKSNIKRCPHMKIFKKEISYENGAPSSETTTEEFNDCYGPFCMAFDEKLKICKIFDIGAINIIDGPPDEEL